MSQDAAEVLVKDRRIKLMAAKTATEEKSAAFAKKTPKDRKIQINTGGNVGRYQAIVVDKIRNQHVVGMVTGVQWPPIDGYPYISGTFRADLAV